MGISARIWPALLRTLEEHAPPLRGCRMLELGNQEFCPPLDRHLGTRSAKAYFASLGVHHTSIDITAGDGALPLDLSRAIDEASLLGAFDVVTNFGTSEHVEPQYDCWRNIHRFTRAGGVMIHEVPEVGHWPGHCRIYYTPAFFRALAAANTYQLLDLRAVNYPDPRNGHLLYAVLRKGDDRPFMPRRALEPLLHTTDAPVTVDEYWREHLCRA
jgi:hypothetical protein